MSRIYVLFLFISINLCFFVVWKFSTDFSYQYFSTWKSESAQQQVSQNVNVAHDDNGGAIDGSNSYDLNSGTVEIDSNSDESSRWVYSIFSNLLRAWVMNRFSNSSWSYSPSENLIPSQSLASFVQFGQSNASLESMEQVVKWLDSLDENILHSAGDADTVDDTEMEIITATVNDCDTLVSDPQLNTGSSGQASTVQNGIWRIRFQLRFYLSLLPYRRAHAAPRTNEWPRKRPHYGRFIAPMYSGTGGLRERSQTIVLLWSMQCVVHD